MSTKLRIAIEVEGIRFFGNQAKAFLRDAIRTTHRMPERLHLRPMKERIEWAFERIPYEHKKLFLFREPAKIKPEDSKYKQLLKDWGMRDNTRNRRPRIQLRPIPRLRRDTARRAAPTPANRRVPTVLDPVFANGNTLQWVPAQTAIDFFGEQMPGERF